MHDLQKGGLALIIGTVSGFVTMAFHPTGHELLAPEQFTRAAYAVVASHSLALLGLPLLFLGAVAIYRQVEVPNRLGLTALVIFGFGLVAGMAAAASAPVVAAIMGRSELVPMLTGFALLVIWKHKDNLARLRAGTEPRVGRASR